METNVDEKLEFFDIIKEAEGIICRNIKLVAFVLLSFFPLLCFSVYFELCLQTTFIEALNFVIPRTNQRYYYFGDLPFESVFHNNAFVPNLINLFFLYLVPNHFLNLINTYIIIDASSTVYTADKRIGFKDLMQNSIKNFTKIRGCFITSLFVLLFSTSALVGFFWIGTNYYVLTKLPLFGNHYFYYRSPESIFLYIFIFLLHGAVFVVLAAKYCKWSAGWNMGLVISVLEDNHVYGSEALELSGYYSRGNERRGLWLMLVFFVYGLALRFPCMLSICSESKLGILSICVCTCLICMGNVFQLVVCVVYYHDSRKRVLEKKADEEIGRRANKSLGT